MVSLCTEVWYVWDRAYIVVWYVQEGKYQQYMLTMCECWEGEWCECVFVCECTLRHTYATRCGCIQQTTHSETIFNKAARPPQSVKTDRPVGSNWRVVKPAESRRGRGGGGGGVGGRGGLEGEGGWRERGVGGRGGLEGEGGWRERGNQSPALPRKPIYTFPAI